MLKLKTNHIETVKKTEDNENIEKHEVSQTEGIKDEIKSYRKPQEKEQAFKPLRRVSLSRQPAMIEEVSPEDLHVKKGSTIALKARFVGEPIPNVRWSKYGHQLTSGEVYYI